MPRAVEIVTRPQYGEIGLRLTVFIETYGPLHENDCLLADGFDQCVRRTRNRAIVRRTNRAHCDDLAIDELHSVTRVKNPGLDHPVIVVNRKKPSVDFDWHSTSRISQSSFPV